MKKQPLFALMGVLLLSLSACGNDQPPEEPSSSEPSSSQTSASTSETPSSESSRPSSSSSSRPSSSSVSSSERPSSSAEPSSSSAEPSSSSSKESSQPSTSTSSEPTPSSSEAPSSEPSSEPSLEPSSEPSSESSITPTYEFAEFVWTFADGRYTAKAKYVSDLDPFDFQYFDAEMSYDVVLNPTCDDSGTGRYTATYDGHSETKDVELDPIGHDYQFDSFLWEEDYTAQAKYVCSHNPEHVEYYTAEVVEEVIREATYERNGLIRYTASFDGHNGSIDREIDMLSVFDFELNEDGKSYTLIEIHNLENMDLLAIPAEYEGLPVTAIGDDVGMEAAPLLRRIVIPKTIVSIGTRFVANANKLSYVFLPKTLEKIGNLSFGYSPRAVYVSDAPSRPSTWSFSSSYTAYYGCEEGENFFMVDGIAYKKTEAGLTVIASDPLAFEEDDILYFGGDHKVLIDEEELPVIGINVYAFYGVKCAVVDLAGSLTVAANAFYDCTSLTIYSHGNYSSCTNNANQIYFSLNPVEIVRENDWYGILEFDGTVLLHYVGEELDITIPTTFKDTPVSRVAGYAISDKTMRSIYVSSEITAMSKSAIHVERAAVISDVTKTPSYWSSYTSGSDINIYYGAMENGFVEHEGAVYFACANSYGHAYFTFLRLLNPDVTTAILAPSITFNATEIYVENIAPNAFIDSNVSCVYIPKVVDTISANPGLTTGKTGSVVVYTNATSRPSGWNTRAIAGLNILYNQPIESMDGLFIKDGLIYQTVEDEDTKTLTVVGYTEQLPSVLSVPEAIVTDAGTLPVTAIAPYAFQKATGVRFVILPNVVEIGEYAFAYSTVQNVELASNLEIIKNNAFYSCEFLRLFDFSGKIREIGNYAFHYCTALEAAEMPDTVTVFGADCFGYCSSLATFTFPEKFAGVIPTNMLQSDSALTRIVIPAGVTEIGQYAFSGCSGLTKLTLPQNLEKIGSYAFANCSRLTRIDIPASVTSVEGYAFSGLTSSSTIFVEASAVDWSTSWKNNCQANIVYGVIPDGEGTYEGIRYYTSQDCAFVCGLEASVTGEITIPEDVVIDGKQYHVRKVLSGAFKNKTAITKVVLPDGVTSIDESAFYGCTGLAEIVMPKGLTAIGASAFYNCTALTEIELPEGLLSIGANAFYGCRSIAELYVPDSCTDIGKLFIQRTALQKLSLPVLDKAFNQYFDTGTIPGLLVIRGGVIPEKAFYSLSPQSVELLEGVTGISANAFASTSLFRLIVPASVEMIGASAFANSNILTVYFRVNEASPTWASNWDANMKKDAVFGFNTDNKEVYASGIHYLIEEDHVSVVYFDGDATQVDLPSSIRGLPVTRIEMLAFLNQTNVKVITVPSSVTFIDKGAFRGCTSLESLTVPFLGSSVGKEVHLCYFFTTTDLSYLTTDAQRGAVVPASLLNVRVNGGALPDGAFGGCSHLVHLYFSDDVTSFGNAMFSGCTSLEFTRVIDADSVTSQNELLYIGTDSNPYKIFVGVSYCGKGTVRIHADCEIIYGEALADNTKARVVVLPNGLKEIRTKAFYNSNIYEVNFPDSITVIGSYAFSKSSLNAAYFGEESQCVGIGDYAFYDVVALQGLTLPGNISTIGSYAFSKTSLTHIDIPASCTYVFDNAFADVYNSSTVFVYIPSTVSVWTKAFANLGNARIVTDADSAPKTWVSDWNSGSMNVRYGISHDRICTSGDVIYLVGYYGTTAEAIAPAPVTSTYTAGSRDLVFPNQVIQGERPAFTVTEIAPYAFYGCLWLKSISFEESAVEMVGEYAFYNCANVISCVLSDDMYYIGVHAFYALNDAAYRVDSYILYLGSTGNDYVLCIGAGRSFSGGAVSIHAGCLIIDRYAFYQREVTAVTLPEGLLGIWESAFAGNGGLSGKTIFIPNSVLYMGQCIFQYARGMSLYLRCGASSAPFGWDEYWNLKYSPVIDKTSTYSTSWGVSA